MCMLSVTLFFQKVLTCELIHKRESNKKFMAVKALVSCVTRSSASMVYIMLDWPVLGSLCYQVISINGIYHVRLTGPWLLVLPGHQHQWYLSCKIDQSFSFMKTNFNCPFLCGSEHWFAMKSIPVYFNQLRSWNMNKKEMIKDWSERSHVAVVINYSYRSLILN